MNMLRPVPMLAILVSGVAYIIQGYCLERSAFYPLLSCWILSFACYIYLIKNRDLFSFGTLTGFALALRVALMFHFPNLSDDIYRFCWDGHLSYAGINPYAWLPREIAANPELFPDFKAVPLYPQLNSGSYFSVYPPVSQLIYYIPAALTSNPALFSFLLKGEILLFDALAFMMMRKLLQKHGKDPSLLFIYFLNPLVIIELSGNAHLEGVMAALFLVGVYFVTVHRLVVAAVFVAASAGVKLLAFIALPYLLPYFGLKKTLKYASLCLLCFFLLFIPFADPGVRLFTNIFSSLALYFQKFEFNASVYFLLRWAGMQLYGYNMIETIGKILPVTTVLYITWQVWLEYKLKRGFAAMLENVLWIYFLFATTVHPWYLVSLVGLAVFTGNLLSLAWSCTVLLSYSFYADPLWDNYLMLWLEYGVLFVLALLRCNTKPIFVSH